MNGPPDRCGRLCVVRGMERSAQARRGQSRRRPNTSVETTTLVSNTALVFTGPHQVAWWPRYRDRRLAHVIGDAGFGQLATHGVG
jgi:hypothetical protein